MGDIQSVSPTTQYIYSIRSSEKSVDLESKFVFRMNIVTLLTSEDRNRCEITVEIRRLISEEISQQMNRKMDEMKRNLDTQITEFINSAIHGSILPSIQNSLSGQNSGLGTNVDSRSSRISRNTERKKHQSAWGNTQSRVQSNLNNYPRSRDSSISSLDCRDDHDMVTGANPTPRIVPEFLTG